MKYEEILKRSYPGTVMMKAYGKMSKRDEVTSTSSMGNFGVSALLILLGIGCTNSPPVASKLPVPVEVPVLQSEVRLWHLRTSSLGESNRLQTAVDILVGSRRADHIIVFRYADGVPYAISTSEFSAWIDKETESTLFIAPNAQAYFECAISPSAGLDVTFGARDKSQMSPFTITVDLNDPRWEADAITGCLKSVSPKNDIELGRASEAPGFDWLNVRANDGVVAEMRRLRALEQHGFRTSLPTTRPAFGGRTVLVERPLDTSDPDIPRVGPSVRSGRTNAARDLAAIVEACMTAH